MGRGHLKEVKEGAAAPIKSAAVFSVISVRKAV